MRVGRSCFRLSSSASVACRSTIATRSSFIAISAYSGFRSPVDKCLTDDCSSCQSTGSVAWNQVSAPLTPVNMVRLRLAFRLQERLYASTQQQITRRTTMKTIDINALETVNGGTPAQLKQAGHLVTKATTGLAEGAIAKFNRTPGGGYLEAVKGFTIKAGQRIGFVLAPKNAPAH